MPGPLRIVLASASPRRSQLLGRASIAFDVEAAHVDEWEEVDADPRALVLHNADLKGAAIAARHPARPVLSADTTVALDGHVLNKPVDLDDARRMLRKLAGRTHTVYTAIVLQMEGRKWRQEACIESRVTFLPFDDTTLERYIGIVHVLDKAGAYGIQEGRELIVERWEGPLDNIMGLPVDTVATLIDQLEADLGVKIERKAPPGGLTP